MIPRIVKRALVLAVILTAMCGRQEREAGSSELATANSQPTTAQATTHPILDAAPRSSQPTREDGARPAVKTEAALLAASADAKTRSERGVGPAEAQLHAPVVPRRSRTTNDGARPRATSRVLSLVADASVQEPEIVCERCPVSVPTAGKMYASDPTLTFLREIPSEAAEVPYHDFTLTQLYAQAEQNERVRPVVSRISSPKVATADEPERVVTVPCDARDREFCSPPPTFQYPQSPYPLSAPLRFAGEVTTPIGFVTHWRYALAVEIRPCSAAERAAWGGESASRVNPCDVKVGEDMALIQPLRIVEPGQ